MAHHEPKFKNQLPTTIVFLLENSLFLIAGALAALIWANTHLESYENFVHFDLLNGRVHHHAPVDHAGADHAATEHPADEHGAAAHADAHHDAPAGRDELAHAAEHHAPHESNAVVAIIERVLRIDPARNPLTVHFLVNDILMALFFAIAGKEVWESLLPGGALSNPRKAATPLLATLGGIAGPAALFYFGAMAIGEAAHLGRGWAIPCATDIAFSYLVARLIFGNGHPAIAFLLLLAIADDAIGLVILAVFYPAKELQLEWLLLTAGAMALCLLFRRAKLHSFWWYLSIPGVLSFISFCQAGIHPALGLVPIIPCLPHAQTDLGIFAREELQRHDSLNEFELFFKYPVEVILGLFGLANAGVVLGSVDSGTWLVLGGLLIGKPLGITLLTWLGEKGLRLEVPAGMSYRHVLTLGMIAGIGFTVALFVSTAAFPVSGPVQDSVKMGALLSFAAAVLAFALARAFGIKPLRPHDFPAL